MLKNKRGGMGSLVALFVVTIFIAGILIIFIATAGIVKNIEGNVNGEKIYNEGEVGIGDVSDYMDDYEKIFLARRRMREGFSIDESLKIERYRAIKQTSLCEEGAC